MLKPALIWISKNWLIICQMIFQKTSRAKRSSRSRISAKGAPDKRWTTVRVTVMRMTTAMAREGRKPIPRSRLQVRPSRRTKPRSYRSGSSTTSTIHIWKRTIRQDSPRPLGWRKNKSPVGSRTTGRGSTKKWPLSPRRRTKIWVSISALN